MSITDNPLINRWRKLLWVDCIGGGIAGILTLLASPWLSKLHQLPLNLLILIGVVNLVYGSYSFSLAMQPKRPKILILLLIVANLAWAGIGVRWAIVFIDTASIFGFVHLLGEAVYVAGLALLQWRWRHLLLVR